MTTTPFPIFVKQNPYLKDKWDIRVGADIGKYQTGEILCTSKFPDYVQHHFMIGDKTNCNILPDVIEVTTYKTKDKNTDPDEIEKVEVFDRTAPKTRKSTKKKKESSQQIVTQQQNNNTPVVISSNPWAAMLGQSFNMASSSDQVVEESTTEESEKES